MTPDRRLRVLFVCTANVCRSPLAESFTSKYSRDVGSPILTASASLDDQIRPTHPRVTAILSEHLIERSHNTSRTLSPDVVDAADLILTMTGEHAIAVGSRHPGALVKIFMLDHVVRVMRKKTAEESVEDWLAHVRSQPRSYPSQPDAHDILDPVNQDETTFRSVASQIDGLTKRLVQAVAPTPDDT